MCSKIVAIEALYIMFLTYSGTAPKTGQPNNKRPVQGANELALSV